MFGVLLFSSLGFFVSMHPLSMGVFLMLSTFFVSICLYFVFGFSWYSYIIIIVFLGGMLILFIYIASLASNELLKFKTPYWMILLMILFIPPMNSIFSKNEISVVKIYENFPISLITLFLASYLLFTFIGVIKIVDIEMGPLREFT